MIWPGIRFINQWAAATNHFHVGIIFTEYSQVRIVKPEVWVPCAHVRKESARVADVQIPNRPRQDDCVPGGETITQDKLSPAQHSSTEAHPNSRRHSGHPPESDRRSSGSEAQPPEPRRILSARARF